MPEINSEVIKIFGNKLRLRVCGIYIEDHKILLLKHISIGKDGILWLPPGGGLQFAETIEQCLEREFREETCLEVKVEEFLFLHEYMEPPLHSIELFFRVSKTGGQPQLGEDPEIKEQIIKELKFISFTDIETNPMQYHQIFGKIKSLEDLQKLKGLKI